MQGEGMSSTVSREEMSSGVSRETQMFIEASSMFPGFRFSPTDVELVSYYLQNKMQGAEKCVEVIPEIEICRYEPWDLPAKSIIQSENEWFFFSARGRKYPNGSQSKRATELGYWKATGKERNVRSGSNVIGTKRTLVFHTGRAPKGERTEWIMHEYCMHGKSQDSLVVCRLRKNIEFRLNDKSKQASLNQKQLSTTHDSSNAVSEGDIDQIGLSEAGKAAECSKKCSSSNDCYSIEQLDSASETEQKLSNEGTLGESSSRQKESDDEEDFYADILKDDIVKLDETSLSVTPELLPIVGSKSAVETIRQEPLQPEELTVSQAPPPGTVPFQGTANRRIKLKRNQTPPVEGFASRVEENILLSSDESQKCWFSVFLPRMGKRPFISVVCIILTFFALLLSLLGGFQQVKRVAYATMYKGSRL